MFFLLALVSMFGYAIQGTFLVKYARGMDEYVLSMYRNLSLGITMLPLLLFVKPADFPPLAENGLLLFLACLSGILGLAFTFVAQRSLPVGVSSALNSLRIVFVLLWGYLFIHESLTVFQVGAIGLIFAGVIFLALRKSHMPHLDGKTWRGIFFSVLSVFSGSVAFYLMSVVSRRASPLLTGYVWEVGIGICALLLVAGRRIFGKIPIEKISLRRFRSIALISSWTLLGTGGFALAVNYGPIGIVNAIGSAGIVLSTLLSHALYQEKLARDQWGAIILVTAGVIGLRLAGA